MGLQQLQVDPLLSESGSEKTLHRKWLKQKSLSCPSSDKVDHEYANCQVASLPDSEETEILETADSTWPCFRS